MIVTMTNESLDIDKLKRASSSNNGLGKDSTELEEIVKIFALDLHNSIKNRFKSKQQYTKEAGDRGTNSQ